MNSGFGVDALSMGEWKMGRGEGRGLREERGCGENEELGFFAKLGRGAVCCAVGVFFWLLSCFCFPSSMFIPPLFSLPLSFSVLGNCQDSFIFFISPFPLPPPQFFLSLCEHPPTRRERFFY